MDYEKKYNEALKAVESLYNVVRYQSSTDALLTFQTLEKAFPELCESEDERIRKSLIHILHVGGYMSPEDKEKAFAWLEKQGEQKPAWSEEDEKKIKGLIKGLEDRMGFGWASDPFSREEYIEWLKSLKGRVQPQPKQECGEEDEKIRKEIISFLENIGIEELKKTSPDIYKWFDWLERQCEQKSVESTKGEDYGIDGLYAAVDILEKTFGKVEGYQSDDGILEHKCAINAVKELSEQKPVWSEEDEENLNGIIKYFDSHIPASASDWIDWLKSLKERKNERRVRCESRA